MDYSSSRFQRLTAAQFDSCFIALSVTLNAYITMRQNVSLHGPWIPPKHSCLFTLQFLSCHAFGYFEQLPCYSRVTQASNYDSPSRVQCDCLPLPLLNLNSATPSQRFVCSAEICSGSWAADECGTVHKRMQKCYSLLARRQVTSWRCLATRLMQSYVTQPVTALSS